MKTNICEYCEYFSFDREHNIFQCHKHLPCDKTIIQFLSGRHSELPHKAIDAENRKIYDKKLFKRRVFNRKEIQEKNNQFLEK